MTFTLGAATYPYLWDLPLELALDRIAGLGLRHLELMTSPPHVWPRGLDAGVLRRAIESRGLCCVSLNPTYLDLNLVSPNPGIREETVRQLQEGVALAGELDARMVVLVVGRKHPLISPDESWLWDTARQGIEACLRTCEQHAVTLGLENAWSVLNRAAQQRRMVEEIRHPRLRIVYDVANATMVERPADGLHLVAPYLVLVHLSDTDEKTWGHHRVGAGIVDFAAAAAALEAIGYAGLSILETTDREDPDGDLVESMARLRSLGWVP